MKESKGIILFAFGHQGYAYFAHNLAMSIKVKNPSLSITLVHDGCIKHLGARAKIFFDKLITVDQNDLYHNGNKEPGKLKCNIAKYLPYDHNLYLDVDAICTHNLEPYLDQMIASEEYYLTTIVGRGGREDEISYSIWATNDQIWKAFKLSNEDQAVAIQSSYAYFQKCKEAEPFYEKVSKNFENFDKSDLYMDWGGSIPDELIYSGTIAQFGLEAEGPEIIFFGNRHTEMSITTLLETYPLLSFYGNGTGNSLVKLRYWELYDRLMHQYAREITKRIKQAYPHIYKTQLLKTK